MAATNSNPGASALKPGPLSRGLFSFASWYARSVPFNPGKGMLQRASLRMLDQSVFTVQTTHGFSFNLRFPEHHGWEDVPFRKSFETGTTNLITRILRPDDVTLDIGANLGWFTVVLARQTPRGMCHAFEPSPANFKQLEVNCALNQLESRTRRNLTALGEREGTVKLFSFSELGCGRSSLSTLGQASFTEEATTMMPLDSYLESHSIHKVDLVKMDVEGAEWKVLDGAAHLLALEPQPVWLLEMNEETASSFDYRPEDLLRRVTERGKWRLIRVPEGWGKPVPMSRIREFKQGDNVVCVPHARPGWVASFPETQK